MVCPAGGLKWLLLEGPWLGLGVGVWLGLGQGDREGACGTAAADDDEEEYGSKGGGHPATHAAVVPGGP